MARFLIILGVAAVVFWVFSVVDCALQPATRHRGVSKGAWIVIVVVLPVLGGILWFVIGRSRPSPAVSGPVAPDDDPAFLGSIGSIADQDDRIRRIEDELAQLDAEDDSGHGTDDGSSKPDDGTRHHGGDDDPRGHRGAIG